VPLDPTHGYQIHGYGLATNAACAALAQRVVARLEANGQPPTNYRVDHAVLNQPMERACAAERDNVGERLREVQRNLA
jgi:hypothetical protein